MSVYDELMAAPEPPVEIRDGLRALEKDLDEQRIVAKSPDGTVTVTVTGGGALVDLTIADRALWGSHPGHIGPAIVTAIHAARMDAARYARDRSQLVFRRGAPPVSTQTVAPPAAGPVTAGSTGLDVDEGDLFRGFRGGR